jgi:hypothetical protein
MIGYDCMPIDMNVLR